MKDRLKIIRKKLKEYNLNAFLINNITNVKYLSGFSGSLAFILILPGKNVFLTDSRYIERSKKEIFAWFCLEDVKNSFSDKLKFFLQKHRIKRLGLESASVSYRQFLNLQEKLAPVTLLPLPEIIEKLRMVKDKEEIKKLRKAVALNDKAFAFIKKILVRTKRVKAVELALRGEVFIKKQGAQGFSFEPIIAFGKDAATPHASISTRDLKADDAVLIDFGSKVQGYNSDLTRVYFKRKYRGKLREIYNIVLTAQMKAIEKIKPGLKASDIDREARDYIVQKGYGKYFGHSLGHGIGLEVHEFPKIAAGNREVLKSGMVFSIEPGIYLPKVGGVRIEDLVLVTQNGCEILSRANK